MTELMSTSKVLWSANMFAEYVEICKRNLDHAVRDCRAGDFRGADGAVAFAKNQLDLGMKLVRQLDLDAKRTHKHKMAGVASEVKP